MREQARDGEVMRDDYGGQAQVGHKAAQKIEQPRLNRHIEPACGLIHEDETRPSDEVPRDLEPLLHSA